MKRVLVQMAGSRRNARRHRPRPGIDLVVRAAGISECVVVADPTDSASAAIAKELSADLRSRVRASIVYTARAAPDRQSAHSLGVATQQLAQVVGHIAKRYPRTDATEMLVSVESGTPAQQVALAQMLHAGTVNDADQPRWAFPVSLALLDEHGATELPFAAPRSIERGLVDSGDREGMLAHLAQLPPGRPVLITGPTGVGKSRAARQLHARWAAMPGRSLEAWEAVNCAAIPANLVEAELFGTEKGAFTGADKPAVGAFEKARGGTLFLDEIGELPLDVQAKLLLALQWREGGYDLRSVGGGRRRSDARVVLATNRDLPELVRHGRFRDDLLARISAHVLRLPALAVRRGDALAEYLTKLTNEPLLGDARFQLTMPAWHRLVRFTFDPASRWRWNYRDVEQSAERLAMRAWAGVGYTSRAWIEIDERVLDAELGLLAECWRSLEPAAADLVAPVPTPSPGKSTPDEGEWAELSRALQPGELESLCALDRWEARYLLEARRATRSQAAAWRWLVERRLLGIGPVGVNPSGTFAKRWRKFRWAVDG